MWSYSSSLWTIRLLDYDKHAQTSDETTINTETEMVEDVCLGVEISAHIRRELGMCLWIGP